MELKVLFVSPEVVPFAKSGGLADVAGSLPPALKRLGVDIRIVMPFYRSVKEGDFKSNVVKEKLAIPIGKQMINARARETRNFEDVPVYFLESEELFDRPNLYGSYMGDYYDNLERFTLLSRGALELSLYLNFIPDIVHCHDWQTGIIPALLKGPYSKATKFDHTSTIFTIHNMGYQGNFPKEKLTATGLPVADFFHPEGLEYWGNISLLKSGIVYGDVITTVSPTYAQEIQTPEYGVGMEGVLQKRKEVIKGIINGVDYSIWNPETDPHIEINYAILNMAGKKKCKEALIKEMKLKKLYKNKPLIGIISRLDLQKGFDLLLSSLDRIMEMDIALILLGSGDPEMEKAFSKAAYKYKGKIGLETGFNNPLAHRIMAGADLFLIPSRYEPCGLTQMYALKYGTVPIVRATGGLNDTINDFDGEKGNGFKFHGYEPSSLLKAIEKAVTLFQDKTKWKKLMSNGMKEDFSWERSARRYLELYESMKRKK
jgi:starch synthase